MAKKLDKSKREEGKEGIQEGGPTQPFILFPGSRALMESCGMKIVSAGIKAFERHPSKVTRSTAVSSRRSKYYRSL